MEKYLILIVGIFVIGFMLGSIRNEVINNKENK